MDWAVAQSNIPLSPESGEFGGLPSSWVGVVPIKQLAAGCLNEPKGLGQPPGHPGADSRSVSPNDADSAIPQRQTKCHWLDCVPQQREILTRTFSPPVVASSLGSPCRHHLSADIPLPIPKSGMVMEK